MIKFQSFYKIISWDILQACCKKKCRRWVIAAQEDWHQQGHSEVRLTSIELLKNLKHELTKASLHAHVRRPRGIWNGAQAAGVNALPVLTRFLTGNPATHLSTQPESHTRKVQNNNSQKPFPVIECSVEWAVGGTHQDEGCSDEAADGQIISLSLHFHL